MRLGFSGFGRAVIVRLGRRWAGAGVLLGGDVGHGRVKGKAEDLDKEVDRVAGFALLRPAPIVLFEDETGKSRQDIIASLT